jgi:hypothetical protein
MTEAELDEYFSQFADRMGDQFVYDLLERVNDAQAKFSDIFGNDDRYV